MNPLLEKFGPKIKPLDLREHYPDLGMLWLRTLSMEEKTRYELGNRHKLHSPEWIEAEVTRPAELLVKVLVDEKGNRLFSELDVIDMQTRDSQLISLLYEVACRWCGLTFSQSIFAAIEAAEKKSVTTGS